MSRAVAAIHGRFGRATIYKLNRPFNIHAHREGHLIFHLSGEDGGVLVSGIPRRATNASVVAVSPWEPHNFVPTDLDDGATFFVLYVNPDWFGDGVDAPRLRFGRSLRAITKARMPGRSPIDDCPRTHVPIKQTRDVRVRSTLSDTDLR